MKGHRWTIRKLFRVEMAHVLAKADSRGCVSTIHGHSYRIELFFTSANLNSDGMVLDFGLVKRKLTNYLKGWDHALVIPDEDVRADAQLCHGGNRFSSLERHHLITGNVRVKQVPYNPTAEEMARDIYQCVKMQFGELSKVRIHETDTGYAEYEEV